MRERLAELWGKLEQRGTSLDGWERLRIPEISSESTYAARDIRSGLEALMLEVSTASIPNTRTLPSSRGFLVIREPIIPGPSGTTRLILALREPAFRDIFFALAIDVASALFKAEGGTTAAVEFLSRVARWQRFVEANGSDGLSELQRRGLAAEVVVLQELLLASGATPEEILQGWTGPRRSPQDFQYPLGCIEVKSALSHSSDTTLHISNIDQLTIDPTKRLILMLVVLGESADNGATLPELVKGCSVAAGDAEDLLWERLHEAGYIPEQERLYQHPRYRTVSRHDFLVDRDFPRLARGQIDPRITAARYSLSVEGIRPYEVKGFSFSSLFFA